MIAHRLIALLCLSLHTAIGCAADVAPPRLHYLYPPASQPSQPSPAQGQDQTNSNATHGRLPTKPPSAQSQQRSLPTRIPGIVAPTAAVKAHFSPRLQRCTQFGNIVSFTGNNLQSLSDYQFKLHTDKIPSAVIPINLSASQIAFKITDPLAMSPGRTYDLHLIHRRSQQRHGQSPLKITICADTRLQQSGFTQQREPNQILVFSPMMQTEAIIDYAVQIGLQVIESHALASLDHHLVLLQGEEKQLNDQLTQLRQRFTAITFDYNHHYLPAAKPRLYATDLIRWSAATPCKNIGKAALRIGLIDGLPDVGHPALNGKMITTQSFLRHRDQADDQHATEIAGMLIGDETSTLLNPLHLISAVALRQQHDTALATAASIVQSINWLLEQQVRLVNISLTSEKSNLIVATAMAKAVDNKMLIFAAAGNDASLEQAAYPAALPGVFAITAIDAARRLYRQANQGPYIDFAAPGVDIWTISAIGHGQYRSGTSYASPYALSIAARYLQTEPDISRQQLYQHLQSHAIDLGSIGQDPLFGWGLVQTEPLCHQQQE